MFDKAIHFFWDTVFDGQVLWQPSSVPWISYYYAESKLYVLRDMRFAWHSFAFVYADSPEEAVQFMLSQGGWKKTIDLLKIGGKECKDI